MCMYGDPTKLQIKEKKRGKGEVLVAAEEALSQVAEVR
jgi:hypothetical protein